MAVSLDRLSLPPIELPPHNAADSAHARELEVVYPMTPIRIAITAYEGVSLLDLGGPLEAFRVASAFAGPRKRRVAYDCSVISMRGGPIKTADGVELVTAPA